MPSRGSEKEAETAGQSDNTTSTPATMEAMDALLQRFAISMTATMDTKLYALEERMNSRIDARSRPSSPVQQTATPQYTPQAPQMTPQQSNQPITQATTVHEDKRWRPEDVGYFNGDSKKVIVFTDRLTSIATSKGVKLVQTNLVTVLQETAFNWYHYELSQHVKLGYDSSQTIEPWCQALIKRFGPSHSDLVSELEACNYTRKDAANRKDATAYIQDVMRITGDSGLKWGQQSGLMTAFHHFEAALQRDLDPPSTQGAQQDALTSFIKQVQLRQEAWFQIYAGYGKPRPPDPYLRQPPRPQQPYQSRSRYSQQPRPQYPQQSRPSQPTPPSRAPEYPPRPQAYWADQEEDDDWEYDAPTDSYHVAHRPPGHTPHRYGNTHDGGGHEARVHWASAGEDHRCSQEGCTHYH